MDRPRDIPLGEVLRFDRFELQPTERRLLVQGVPAPLGARAFDLLLALVARAGRLVGKHELLDEVWPGLVVEEANLSVQVSALRKVLGGELIATIPGRGYRFTGRLEGAAERSGGTAAPGPAPAPALAPSSPPAPSPPAPAPAAQAPSVLIGRDLELAAALAAVVLPGCLTLVGPAGVGKTTLARALARAAPGGAVWVDLAPLTEGTAVLAALARALDMAEPGADAAGVLARRIGARLLVLDNGEHVIDAAAVLVGQLLQAEPALRVLATSQLRLAVAGERVHRLEPLALPRDDDDQGLQQAAVALFVERVRSADHRFQPTPAQLPLLGAICRRLDGLPLALEMAAARVPALGLPGLAEALEGRMALLTGGRRDAASRHRSLQAAVDWSHGLLAPAEQRLYRLCGVFTGGFTFEVLLAVAASAGAQAVATSGAAGAQAGARIATGVPDDERWALLDSLAQLVDRSLVVVDADESDPQAPPRYRMLETLRDDAARRLSSQGETPGARDRLLAALAELGRRCLQPAAAGGLPPALLLAEHDNLRAALEWGRTRPDAAVRQNTVQLAVDTAIAATFATWRLEAMRWLDACEALVEDPVLPLPVPLCARWWTERSRQWLMSRHPAARAMAERALALVRDLGDDRAEFEVLSSLVRTGSGSIDELEAQCQAMRDLLARHPQWPLSRAVTLAGAEAMVLDLRGDTEGLLRCRRRELDLARQAGNQGGVEAAETNVIFVLQDLDRHDEALEMARGLTGRLGAIESGNAAYAWIGLLTSLRALGRHAEFRAVAPHAQRVLRRHGLPLLAPQQAQLLAAEQRHADALALIGHARERYARAAMSMTTQEVAALDQAEQRARQALGAEAAGAALAAGAAMGEADADALALRPPAAG